MLFRAGRRRSLAVIAVDTNILIYAHREDSPFYKKASACIKRLAEGRLPWAIPWPCIHEFYSIITHPKIYDPPSPINIAIGQIDAWMESPSLVLLSESVLYWDKLRKLIVSSKTTGPLIHDARISALCIDHGVTELLTSDRDFGRFPSLKIRNPLVD
jgi:toxin-antitoxin system PIN domain toxin